MTYRQDPEIFTTGNRNDITHGSAASLKPRRKYRKAAETGFSLVEMLLSATILLVISMAVFGALNRIQQAASFQAEVQAVVDNTRNALQSVERCLRQAGNDPFQKGFEAMRVQEHLAAVGDLRSRIRQAAGRRKTGASRRAP